MEESQNLSTEIIIRDAKLITQEAPMGCAIACCASLAGLSYKQMREYFDGGEIKEQTSGFYNKDIISALKKVGIQVKCFSAEKWGNKEIKNGTIVFIESSKTYPMGHFLLKTKNGWMNPWINYPSADPIRAGFQETLSEKISWIIETVTGSE